MADIYLEEALKSLAEDEEKLGRLISAIEADRSKDRAAKLPKERPKFEPATKESADYVARNLTADANKNLNRIFGGLNGGQVQKEIARQITGPIEYRNFVADVILHILCEAVPYIGGRSDNDTRAGLRFAIEKLIAETNSKGLAAALRDIDSAANFPWTMLTSFIATQTGIKPPTAPAGGVAPTVVANPIKGLMFQLLLPYNIEYIKYVDAKTQRIRAADAEMKAFIANQAAQRAVILALRSMTASDKVLMPIEIGGTAVSDVEAALKAYPAKDLDDTYNFYKKAYDHVSSKGGAIAAETIKPFIDAAIKQLNTAKSLIGGLPFNAKSKSRFSRAIDVITGREILSASSSELDDQSKIELAYLSLAELCGAVSNTPSLIAPFNAGSALHTAVAAELTTLGSNYQSSFPTSGLTVDDLDLQAALKPSSLSAASFDPMYGEVKNAIASAATLLVQAYPLATSVSAVGLNPSLSAPLGASRAAPMVTAEFKAEVNKALLEVVDIVKNFGTRMSSATPIYNEGLDTYLQALTGDQGLTHSAVVAGWAAPNVPEAFYLTLASSEGVNGLAQGAGGVDALKKSIIRVAQSKVATSASARPISVADRRLLPVLLNDAFTQIDEFLDGTVEQLRNSGMKLRSNPSEWYDQSSVGGRIAVGAGALYGTHAITALVNSIAQPKDGSMGALAANILPTLAVAGVGGGLAHKHDKQGAMISLIGGGIAHLALRHIGKMDSVRFGSGALAHGFQYVVNGPAYLVGDASMGYCSALPFSVAAADDAGRAQIIKVCRMNSPVAAAVLGMQAALRGASLKAITVEQQNIVLEVDPKGGPDLAKIQAMPVSSDAEIAEKAAAYHVALTLIGDTAKAFCQLSHLMNEGGVEYGADGVPTAKFEEAKLLSKDACKANQTEAQKYCPSLDVAIADMKTLPAPPVAPEAAPAAAEGAASADGAAEGAATPTAGYRSLGNYIQMPGYQVTGVYQDEDTMEYLRPSPKTSADPGIQQLNAVLERARVLTPSQLVHEGYADIRDTTVLFVDPRVALRAHSCGLGTDLGQSRMNPSAHLFALDVESDVGNTPIYPEDNFNVPQGKLSHKRVIGSGMTEVVTPTGGSFGGGVFKPRF